MIRPISFIDVFEDPNAQQLIAEYAAECSIPEIGEVNPAMELYRRMEQMGLTTFGVFDESNLIGFATCLIHPLPHYGGKKVATVESLFIASGHRKGGLGRALIMTLKEHAKRAGCKMLFFSAPAGSRLERMLPLMGFRHTNTVFGKSLD
jgi:GNAT superfamily N-acetyltransferase